MGSQNDLGLLCPRNRGIHYVAISGLVHCCLGNARSFADDAIRGARAFGRHCERSEAIQLPFLWGDGLLRFARNDVRIRLRDLAAYLREV